jgi:hypothetical protein
LLNSSFPSLQAESAKLQLTLAWEREDGEIGVKDECEGAEGPVSKFRTEIRAREAGCAV